jgi:hypothetical protein
MNGPESSIKSKSKNSYKQSHILMAAISKSCPKRMAAVCVTQRARVT